MKRGIVTGLKRSQPRRTVLQLRELLEQFLAETEQDETLNGSAEFVRCAIDALDDARAMALTVMREAEAECGALH